MPFIPTEEHDRLPEQSQRVDYNDIDANLAEDVQGRVESWYSDKKIKLSAGWLAIGNKGSLKVNAADGHWHNHETGESGPGLLSLYASRYGVDLGRAAEDLSSNVVPFRKVREGSGKVREHSSPQWEHSEIPPDSYPDSHFDNGKADHIYKYRDRHGNPVGVVLRWDEDEWQGRESKDIRPVSWVQMRGKTEPEWKWCAFAEPRPLYRGERIDAEPDKPILIVEGEKAVEAAEKALPDWIVVTWPGGASAQHKADWSGMERHRIVVWPDNDEAGHKAAEWIKSQFPVAQIVDVSKLPEKADCADLEPEQIAAMLPPEREIPKIEQGMANMPISFEEAKSRRPEVIMDGLIYAGSKMLVGGSAKAGKSHFVMDLVASLSRGQTFLKWRPQRQYRVLYVDFELHEWELRERAGRAFNWQIPDNFGRLSLRRHYGVRNPSSLTKLFDAIDISSWEVIILDCLYKFNQAEDENDNAQMQEICAWMDLVVSRYSVTPIVIHHFGKGAQGSKSVIDRFRGASSLVGDMDAILSLTPHEEDGNVIIETEVRSFAPTEAFVVKWDYPHFIIDESKDASKHAKPGAKRKHSDEEILRILPVGEERAMHYANLGCDIAKGTFDRRIREIEGAYSVQKRNFRGKMENAYFRA